MKKRANMMFTGIASFGRCAIVNVDSPWEADFAIFGAPYDEGTGFRPGTRFGPRGIRDSSLRFAVLGGDGFDGYWDIERKSYFLRGVRVVDAADADILYLDIDHSFQSITNGVKSIISHNAIPVVLGGDHSISYPVVRAFEKSGPIYVVHLDAHLDFRDEVLGVRLAHGSPLRRIVELPFVEGALAIGIRGMQNRKSDYEDAIKKSVTVITGQEMRSWTSDRDIEEKLVELLPAMKNVYVTVDIDFIDPAYAPGIGTPEPGGVAYPVLRKILRTIADNCRVVGFDLVEINPMTDHAQMTQLLGAQIIVEFMAAIWQKIHPNN